MSLIKDEWPAFLGIIGMLSLAAWLFVHVLSIDTSTRWEYQTVQIEDPRVRISEHRASIDHAGEQGWELVQVAVIDDHCLAWFKREKR